MTTKMVVESRNLLQRCSAHVAPQAHKRFAIVMFYVTLGVTRMDKIKNEFIRGTAHLRQIGDKVKLGWWYGRMQRQNAGYIGKRMLCLELPGKRRRGRPKTRFMDVVREDMRVIGVSDTTSRRNWKLRRPLMGAAERKRRRS